MSIEIESIDIMLHAVVRNYKFSRNNKERIVFGVLSRIPDAANSEALRKKLALLAGVECFGYIFSLSKPEYVTGYLINLLAALYNSVNRPVGILLPDGHHLFLEKILPRGIFFVGSSEKKILLKMKAF